MLNLKSLQRRWRGIKWGATAFVWAMQQAMDERSEPPKPLTFAYGGQAVIEGVMMRGQYVAAVAVRHPNGAIVTKEIPLKAALYRGRIARLPFVRGLIMLWDAMVLGMGALMWSADVALEEEEEEAFSFEGVAGIGVVLVAVGLMLGLFVVIPAAISDVIKDLTGLHSRFFADLIEGVVKLGILVGYVWLISHMNDVKRLFGYHGAEHKTINAYEAGAELTPETVATYPIQHPRCGTAFLLTVILISVLVHFVTGRPDNLILLLLMRLALIFPIAGIAYETIRFTSKHLDNPVIRLIIKPNLALQNLTTRQPDRGMLEVGIWALQRVLEAERAGVPIPETRVTQVALQPTGD
jgi:uncharacterized protein YqhQ